MNDPEDRLSLIGVLSTEDIPPDVLQFLEDYATAATDRARIEALAAELDRLHQKQYMVPQKTGHSGVWGYEFDLFNHTTKIFLEPMKQ